MTSPTRGRHRPPDVDIRTRWRRIARMLTGRRKRRRPLSMTLALAVLSGVLTAGLATVPSTAVATESDASASDHQKAGDSAGQNAGSENADAPAVEAAGTPVYEITGQWVNPPDTIARGNPVVAEWRVNVNDDEEPPSNDPVDNVTATFTVEKAFFDEIPDLCLTEGVDPVSSISEDGTELTCNFGTVNMGTALVVQTPVVANGITGEEVVLDGTGPGGQTVDLPPIEILNPFRMDIRYGQNTNQEAWNDDFTRVDVDVQWTLRLGKGSDPGPDRVRYRLNVSEINGHNVNVGVSPRSGVRGCGRFDRGRAEGHPWSRDDLPPEDPRNAAFVDECTLTKLRPGVFELTLSGINYDLLNAPDNDSTNNPLPPNWDAVASGTLWFRVITDEAGSIRVDSNEPTYTAPTGQQFQDRAGNNVTNKSYTLPGAFSAWWQRSYTRSGGTPWDDTYRVSVGTTVRQNTNNRFSADDAPANSQYGNCIALDYAYSRLTPDAPVELVAWSDEQGGTVIDPPRPLEYYVGPAPGNPDQFDCGSRPGSWTTSPDNLGAVKAVRARWPFATFARNDADVIQLRVPSRIRANTPVGQDVWTFGSALRQGEWLGPDRGNAITRTPNARYPYTTGRRDILRIITAEPHLEKSAAQSTVTPGVPAEFTLTYSANGSGIIPETVDGYVIRDVLPVGMTYEPGSADPEPEVSTNAQGEQVLTWRLDGVATNTEHELTYQAVADTSIEPGTQLTNRARSAFGGERSDWVDETVTTTTNGYTIILKTSDVAYIPNVEGDGVGQGSWTVAIESQDPIAQAFTDTIDILPYNGDGRGTSFSGSYTLDEVVTPDGGTVYYTDADPATLSDDPADESNGAAGDPTGNTVGWTTERPENPTAVRVIGGELESGGTFSFQIVITTDGAEPQDVYVNRAQARAEHTELVMRTSAVLIVTDYVVEKSSDPESGTTVKPGDTITYTIEVTQVGDVPAGAVFTDDVSDVLDDAIYNGDLDADIGEATLEDGVISWEGEIPVGEVAHITYSVTVKDIEGLDAEGSAFLNNQVESPGCPPQDDEGDPCQTEHPVGWYEYSKTSDPEPGSTVQTGDVVTYSVEIIQRGEGAIEDAVVTDDLSAVLDDADWNDDAQASAGELSFDEPNLTWTGDLAVGDTVTLTYSVTVTDEGDFELANVVTSPDEERSRCVPAPDENPDCQTAHEMGDYEVVKTSDPESGESVEPGDVVTYTVSVSHIGKAPIEASFEDDLSAVLDDAVYNDDADASAGETSYEEPTLTWTGDLEQGDEVTVTYSVTVNAEGDRHLVNVVTTPGVCLPAEGQDEACTTEHFNGAYVFSKTSDPEPGSEVQEGDVVTYTVTVEHVGTSPVEDARVVDDLSEVSEVASWNDDAEASSGEVSRDGSEVTWTGDLDVEQVVTITYSVTVGDEADATMRNVVTSDDERAVCVPAEDGNPDCTTDHHTPSEDDLPDTGSSLAPWVLVGGLVLLLGGLGLAASTRRRAGAATSDGTDGGASTLV